MCTPSSDEACAWHEGADPDGPDDAPADVGNAVTLLCAVEAGSITGQVIGVNGGSSVMDAVFPLAIQRG